MSVASFGFRRNDWTRRLLTTAPLGSRDGRPVSSRETPARCSHVALAASLSPRYDLPDLTINFWYSVFVRAVKKDGATSRVFWRTYVHIGAESRSRRSPCRLGLRAPHRRMLPGVSTTPESRIRVVLMDTLGDPMLRVQYLGTSHSSSMSMGDASKYSTGTSIYPKIMIA